MGYYIVVRTNKHVLLLSHESVEKNETTEDHTRHEASQQMFERVK